MRKMSLLSLDELIKIENNVFNSKCNTQFVTKLDERGAG